MRVHIIHDPPTRRVEVYFIQNDRYLKNDEWIYYEPGARPEPSVVFDIDAWDAMMKEACGSRSEDADGIRDARQVRDRLLTIVEKDHERMEKQAEVMFNHLMK